MTTRFLLVIAIGFMTWIGSLGAAIIAAEVVMPDLDVDVDGDKNVFAIPFDYGDGLVFAVHVEPPLAGGPPGMNLRTVVRKGTRRTDGHWDWQSTVVESRTLNDPWHNQASIALDRLGYVHVAYNMHNMPWQYSVSSAPYDISNFNFRGQEITFRDLEAVKIHNRTPFPDAGTAQVPGNQVTYPMFFTDKQGELFLTYRFALKPARQWERRAFAGGIAKYDVRTRQWTPIGGRVPILSGDATFPTGAAITHYFPFAFRDTYSVYLINLAFDDRNGMHAFWHWRPGGAGMETILPTYAYSPNGHDFFRDDGGRYVLPVDVSSSSVIGSMPPNRQFYAPKSAAILANGDPIVVLQPLSGGRVLYSLDRRTGRWFGPEPSPAGASQIVIDRTDRQWAFSSGLRVFTRGASKTNWREVGQIGAGLCSPKVKYIESENRFFVHSKTCDGRRASIRSFRP